MGVLDDLKREAKTIRELQEQAHSKALSERDNILERVAPRMTALAEYLRDMAASLTVVQPDVRFDYDVHGCGSLKALEQCEYRAVVPDARPIEHVTFQFQCRSTGTVRFEVVGKDAAERQRQYLWSHNLRFTSKLSADAVGSFTLEKMVPVSFEFQAMMDSGVIRLRVRNLEQLGAHNMSFEPEQVDEEFMEELAKAALRQPSRFRELSGNTISEEARRELQQKLVADQYRKLAPEQQLLEDTQQSKRGPLTKLFRR
ncbi:MAG: hypothetical protein K0U93_01845 [Gammaproteobacteria bacterium]|nr:hypothetical protein [Gammaproteobacteria bacterium]